MNISHLIRRDIKNQFKILKYIRPNHKRFQTLKSQLNQRLKNTYIYVKYNETSITQTSGLIYQTYPYPYCFLNLGVRFFVILAIVSATKYNEILNVPPNYAPISYYVIQKSIITSASLNNLLYMYIVCTTQVLEFIT